MVNLQVVDKFKANVFVLIADRERCKFEQEGTVRVFLPERIHFLVELLNHEEAQV